MHQFDYIKIVKWNRDSLLIFAAETALSLKSLGGVTRTFCHLKLPKFDLLEAK